MAELVTEGVEAMFFGGAVTAGLLLSVNASSSFHASMSADLSFSSRLAGSTTVGVVVCASLLVALVVVVVASPPYF